MNIKGSYKKDCIFLLKDLTGILKEISIEEKEKLIAQGISYSNFISKEEKPNEDIEELFLKMLSCEASKIAEYVAILAEKIYKEKMEDLIIVSLARAGTPYGILIRKYLKLKYNIDIKHYSISIIRGKGIDFNALKYILDENKNAKIQFVDGWTGKGSIINELDKSITEFNRRYNQNIDKSLAVIADPAKLCEIYGTREDISVPNSVLNATVSGLISRTILNDKYIGKNDFHGAINIEYLKENDYSDFYVDEIAKCFTKNVECGIAEKIDSKYSKQVSQKIKDKYHVDDINKVKLSIGEASRVLLRRKAKVVLLKDIDDKEVKQLIILAKAKKVPIEIYKESDYKAIAIIAQEEKQ
ncbi:MAG: cysteine protease StiP domain-containing protein [Sarcina sp.]